MLVDREGKIQLRITGGQSLSYYESVVRPLIRGRTNLRMNFNVQPGHLVLSWPNTEFGYFVEGARDLATNAWDQFATPVTEVDNQNTVTIPTGGGPMFFRLRKP